MKKTIKNRKILQTKNLSLSKAADRERNNTLTFKIALAGDPNSCCLTLEKNKLRASVDSGAEVSLINMKIYQSLKTYTHLKKINVN